MRLPTRSLAALGAIVLALSCADAPTAPPRLSSRALPLGGASAYEGPQILISQIYGGGGNAGATLRNDFIELFNPTSTAVNVSGWRVAYASATGSSWSYTPLTGVIQPGGYYLIQQAQGTGGTASLPTPDASGTIAMSATAGKIVLVSDGSALSGTCPVGAPVVDRVAFGSSTAAGNCVPEWTSRTPAPSNTNAVIRGENGCAYTGSPNADFAAALPNPRNTASPTITPCDGGAAGPVVDSVAVSPSADTLFVGDTVTLVSEAYDTTGAVLDVPRAYATSSAAIATVSPAGLVTAIGAGTATITVSAGAASATVEIVVYATPREVSPIDLQINELMGDPANAESASWGEWFEVRNNGSEPVDLQGWRILSGGSGQPAHTITASVIVPAGGYAVLGRGFDFNRNGGVNIDYNYFTGSSSTIWLDNNDYLVLLDGSQALVDSLSWTSLPRGVTKGLRPGVAPVSSADGAEWGFSTTTFGDGDYGTPGAENTGLGDVAPVVSANRITTSGRETADTLPTGFEDQLFATLRSPSDIVIPSTFAWASLTPDIISVDARGVIRGVAAGTGTIRVTAEDGTGRNVRFVVKDFLASGAAYGAASEFGLPVDADASDDFLVSRNEFTSSWNGARGIPNWVAYNLTSDHIVPGTERCDCFTFDPQLETAGFARYTTADYTGAGTFAGAGIDRGHLARSFDRTAGQLDNARTFYFSNIIPQFSDNNQGPWAQHENYLGDLAEAQNKELTIFAGASGSLGTVKGEGLITVPAWTWKVSVIAPRGTRLEDVRDYRDLQVIAVVMPNAPGIRNVDWQSAYVVTADSVERLSGYRFLTALPEKTRRALVTGTQPPLAAIAPTAGTEGSPIAFDAAGSVDPNGSIVSYAWDFGDGNTGSGATPAHTYTFAGNYTVRLITTDNDGLADTVSTTLDVAQATPTQALALLSAAVEALPSEPRHRLDVLGLRLKVRLIEASITRDKRRATLALLDAMEHYVDALERRRFTTAQLQPVRDSIERLRRSLQT